MIATRHMALHRGGDAVMRAGSGPRPAISGGSLPMSLEIQRELAQSRPMPRLHFADAKLPFKFRGVVLGAAKSCLAMCQYRYPSPCGRPGVPQVRPPAFFACKKAYNHENHAHQSGNKAPLAQSNVGKPTRGSLKNKSALIIEDLKAWHSLRNGLQFPLCAWGLPHAVNQHRIRRSLAVSLASVLRASLTPTRQPARSSARSQTSPIVRPTPAPATKHQQISLVRIARTKTTNHHMNTSPRRSTTATGVSFVTFPAAQLGAGPRTGKGPRCSRKS